MTESVTPDDPAAPGPAPEPSSDASPVMTRRDALRATAALLGTALGVAAVGGAALGSAACGPDATPRPPAAPPRLLGADDEALAELIADTLLPTTDASPGARAAGVGPAMNLLATDCYEPDAQRRVVGGLAEFRLACRRRGVDFARLSVPERERLLREVDAEAGRVGDAHYFGPLRELAEHAYFTSAVGVTRALRYVREPGRWDGCVPLAPGQPAWA